MREPRELEASAQNEVHRSGIPTTFHYCWFGGAPKPPLVLKCIESWRRFMPEWDIVEWNESNFPVSDTAYTREAFQCGMWAFVSDYARFDVLFAHGGVYMDTDVELLKPIPDWVLADQAFTGMESGAFVNPGQIFGCVPKFAVLAEILASYGEQHFLVDGRMNTQTVNHRVTEILARHGLTRTDVLQRVAGLTVHPSEYFCGYDMDTHAPTITERTISVHHCSHSWGSKAELSRRRKQEALRRVIGTSRYRWLLNVKRRLFGVRDSQQAQASVGPRGSARQ